MIAGGTAMVVRVVIVLAALALSGCAPSGDPRRSADANEGALSRLRFPPDRDKIVFHVTERDTLLLSDAVSVNGKNLGWFVIDTGASFSCLDRRAAREL